MIPWRTPHDWLSRDEAQVDAYLSDPLCGFELQEAARASMFASSVGARQDQRLKDVDHRVYPGGRREMFNETCRMEVEADFIAWLDARFNP
jgi:alpha-beta hydrolase superfamily lysophospholipase